MVLVLTHVPSLCGIMHTVHIPHYMSGNFYLLYFRLNPLISIVLCFLAWFPTQRMMCDLHYFTVSFRWARQMLPSHSQFDLFFYPLQITGHNIADLDPLGINDTDLDSSVPPELQLKNAG